MSPQVFVVLGTGAALQEDYRLAQKYLQFAYDRGDRSAALLNNLAWVMIQQTPTDWEAALTLVNEAIAADPHFADARVTRADILIALSRFREAIVDLELAYQRAATSRDIRDRLARCYEGLGDTELANAFRQSIDQ